MLLEDAVEREPHRVVARVHHLVGAARVREVDDRLRVVARRERGGRVVEVRPLQQQLGREVGPRLAAVAGDELQLGEVPAHLVDQADVLRRERHARSGHARAHADRDVELDALRVQRIELRVVDRHLRVHARGERGRRLHAELLDRPLQIAHAVHARGSGRPRSCRRSDRGARAAPAASRRSGPRGTTRRACPSRCRSLSICSSRNRTGSSPGSGCGTSLNMYCAGNSKSSSDSRSRRFCAQELCTCASRRGTAARSSGRSRRCPQGWVMRSNVAAALGTGQIEPDRFSGVDWGHASDLDDVRGQVAIAGIGETAYTKASGRTAREIGAEAAEKAIADAGLEPADIDGITWSGAFADFDEAAFHEHFGTTHEMWTSPWGGGMAWAATAPYLAAQRDRRGPGPARAERVPGRVGDATRVDDGRARARCTPRSRRSRTSRCRSAGSRSPCTSRRSCAGTCSSSARRPSSSARSRSRAAATRTSIPKR